MARHDESNSPLPDGQQPLVPAGHTHDPHGGQAIAVHQPYASPSYSRTPAVVNGGMDTSWFINSLRRRWLLATFMSLLLASGVGVTLFLLFPESDTAVRRFWVKSQPEVIMYRDLDVSSAAVDLDVFRATQVATVTSYNVLQTALQDSKLRQIKELQNEDSPVMWLQENLDVRFEGDSEYLNISMTLDKPGPEQLKAIVDAVSGAYFDAVVTEERLGRVKIRDSLRATYNKLKEDIRNKWDEYHQMATDIGIAEGSYDPTVRLIFEEITSKLKEKQRLEEQIIQIQQQFATWKAYKDNPDLNDQKIDAMVSEDPDVMIMEQELLALKARYRLAQKRSSGRKTKEMDRIEKEISVAQQQMNQQRQQIREGIKQQMANAPDVELALVTQEYQRQLQYALGRKKQLVEGYDDQKPDGTIVREQGIDELRAEIAAKVEGSTDLLVREAELEQMETMARELGRRVESWDIELQAKPRVTALGNAYHLPGINRLQRFIIAGIGATATLLLSCLGIGYLEFLRRRLNGPEQLDEGLGIRVVGTLPALNAKRMMNPKHPLVAQLTESIDSVRTALMHDSTSKARQVVLVTSPAAMEGRTTVASQLAASLARAGRRTLLIDGDLRRPALHSLFDVPLEDGLCEVLRAEAEVSDVVRPTHAEGLWLMTAGYCDADAVHAMATDQIQPIFEKLRADYDFVIIDGAPVLGLSDSLMIGQHCDGALLSVLRDHTTVPSIYKSSELLRDVGVRLVGSVVNGVTAKADRRVTHLQITSPKSTRKQLESQTEEEVAVATQSAEIDELDDLDFGDLSSDD